VTRGEIIPLDEHFAGFEESRPLYDVVERAVLELGGVEVRPMKSQVAFVRRRGFAWTWMSARYLEGDFPPLVLSVGLDRHDESPRWKQVVEVRPGKFMHHLELRSAEEIDEQVRAWLREAWELAG